MAPARNTIGRITSSSTKRWPAQQRAFLRSPGASRPRRSSRATAAGELAAIEPRNLNDPELYINRELSLRRLPASRARRGARRIQSAARPADVPVVRRLEHRRVLHGPGRRPEAADREGRGRNRARRHDSDRAVARHSRLGHSSVSRFLRHLAARVGAGADQRRNPHSSITRS